ARSLIAIALGACGGGRRRAKHIKEPAVSRPAHGAAEARRLGAEHVPDPQAGDLDRIGIYVTGPDSDPVRLVHGEREPAPVRCPGWHAHLSVRRQSEGALGAVTDPHHGKPGEPPRPLPPADTRVQPQAEA